jgi:hypothetical protein
MPALAAELVREHVDVIVAASPPIRRAKGLAGVLGGGGGHSDRATMVRVSVTR